MSDESGMAGPEVDGLNRYADWSGIRVAVAGIGLAGSACARAMAGLGADVIAVDSGDSADHQLRAGRLTDIGVTVRLGDGNTLPPAIDLLVVSPGLPPYAPIIEAAQRSGVPVWGELELAWRLRSEDAAPWLVITGTNGKTTATLMLAAMLRAGGRRAIAAGNIGVPLVDSILADDLDVIAVEVGAPQLPFWHTVSPLAAVCLNLAPDHVDFFGSFEAYQAAKAKIYQRCQVAAVYNSADAPTMDMVRNARVAEGCRAVGFTLTAPRPGELGVVDDYLVDRAFVPDPQNVAREIAEVSDVRPPAPHNVANALAAAALALAYGLTPAQIRDGLQSFEPAGHRITDVATVAGVRYVDDSKATNTHAASTSLNAYDSVIWIAGGLAKGQSFDELVVECADRMRAVVLLGKDRPVIAEALARHAPDIPVVEVPTTDTGAMAEVVHSSAELAQPGDTVLLAPGCASWDMFTNFAERGDRFAEEVLRLDDRDDSEPGGSAV